MIKNCLFVLVLASVALWVGCARGLKSVATVTVTGDKSVVAVSLTATFSAEINGTPSTAVNWTLSSSSCTGSACGSISSAGVYSAPDSLPTGKKSMVITVTATSQADAAAQGQATITVFPITVYVTPGPLQVGQGLVQQFTAVAIPDYISQTFTWTCQLSGGAACANFAPGANGAMAYTAADGACGNGCVTITATSAVNPTSPSSGSASASVLASRVSGTYAFRFAGYDNAMDRLALAGTVTFSTTGAFGGGVVDEVITTSAGHHQYPLASAVYQPSTASDKNTNDAGTLTLGFNGSSIQFQTVLTSSGEIRMIQSDGNGTGSGVMQKSATSQFTNSTQSFAFLFTGVDPLGNRAGFAGVATLDGQGHVSGTMDVNYDGSPSTYSSIGGTYGPVTAIGTWPLTITTGGQGWSFVFYVGAGQAQNGTKNPLNLLAVSTDSPNSTHPALSGILTFQDPGVTYDKTALNSSAVVHLDGISVNTVTNTVQSMVSLALASGDSNGNISGSFDALNFPTQGMTVSAQNFNCTYASGSGGRYVVTLLGNGSTCTTPALSFVFYATGANRGFLLDQSSTAVMVGAMEPQASSNALNGTFADSALPGTYEAATVSDGTTAVIPETANLLLTFQGFDASGKPIANATATLYEPSIQPLAAGSYSIQFTGTGTITLTPSGATNPDKFIFYAIDTSHFWMIQTQDATGNAPANPSVIVVQQ